MSCPEESQKDTPFFSCKNWAQAKIHPFNGSTYLFTGIIHECCRISRLQKRGKILSFAIESSTVAKNSQKGASIAIDGVCQTITNFEGDHVFFEAVDETLNKTTLSLLKVGQEIHLEPALSLSSPLDGHLVYGHVDGVGEVEFMNQERGRFDLKVKAPRGLGRYFLEGGSVAIDGVSLTIFSTEGDTCTVTLIPETLKRTHFSRFKKGHKVNLEMDVMGKWMEKLLLSKDPDILKKKMAKWGF